MHFGVLTVCDLSNHQVYNQLGQGLLERLFQGYNISVLAYGQTGAGKTHTMTGPPGNGATGSNRGLIPRMMEELMRRKQNLELQGRRSVSWTPKNVFVQDYVASVEEASGLGCRGTILAPP